MQKVKGLHLLISNFGTPYKLMHTNNFDPDPTAHYFVLVTPRENVPT